MVRQKEGEPCCICPCPCEGLVDVIGKKWVLCALAQLGNVAVQSSGSEASRDKREDSERCFERLATKRACQTCSLSGNPSPRRIFLDPRGKRVDHACGTVDGLG